jgi:hypothetical protein
VSLAFEVPGGWHDEKTAVTTTILQVLLTNIDVTQILDFFFLLKTLWFLVV